MDTEYKLITKIIKNANDDKYQDGFNDGLLIANLINRKQLLEEIFKRKEK